MVNKVHTKTYKWKESVFFFKGGGISEASLATL